VSLGKIERLVLIDDSAVDQHLYRRMILRSGRVEEVISFRLAEDALAYLFAADTPEPDLILLDVSMPTMDGFEFLDALKARFGNRDFSIVVMLTTSLDLADTDRAAETLAVKDYLNKPLTARRLDELITWAWRLKQTPRYQGPHIKIVPKISVGAVD